MSEAEGKKAEILETEAEKSGEPLEQIEWQAEGLDFVEEEPVVEEEVELEAAEPTEFIEADRMISILESLLFASDRPVSLSTIKQVFKGSNVRSKDLQRALEQLASVYADSARGVTLEEVQGGYQLRSKLDNADYLRRLAKTRPFRLSGPALEVLAIVAYKQPLIKAEIDEIRGVESGHLLRALMERGLVNFAGKSDLPGKPMQYETTRKFLEIFGLRNLKELPTLSEIDQLIPEGIGEVEEDRLKLSDLTEQMSEALKSSYSDGEEELSKITESLSGIDTSSEFFEQEKIRQREKRDRDRAQDIREALAVGEAVDDKDRKWLERYEAKQLEVATLVEAAAQAVATSHQEGETQGETLSESLENLTAESDALFADEPDDLDVRPDYDDAESV